MHSPPRLGKPALRHGKLEVVLTMCLLLPTYKANSTSTTLLPVFAANSINTAHIQKRWWPVQGLLKRWRKVVMEHLHHKCQPQMSVCQELDVYQFGVFTGRSLKVMAGQLLEGHSQVPHVRVAHKIWGFDSFIGISEDAPEKDAAFRVITGGSYHSKFKPRQFSALDASGARTVADVMSMVQEYVRSGPLSGPDHVGLIGGFLNESLTPSLAADRKMAPALYVDIDVDIYTPTFEALDWMFRNRLMVNGTVIGYDDFNHGMPLNERSWEHARLGKLEGEPRAHREIEHKWGVRMVQIQSVPNHGGQSGWAFTVVM